MAAPALCVLGALLALGCNEKPTEVELTIAPIAQVSKDPRIDVAVTRLARGDLATARELLTAVLGDFPREGRALVLLGVTAQREHRYEVARGLFERALALGPTFTEHSSAHHFHGWCLLDLGEAELARAAFEKHLEHEPEASDSHFALGRIDFEAGRLEEAERRFRRAIELDAGNSRRAKNIAKARTRLADVLLARDELGGALAELDRAVELTPGMHQAHYKRSRVLRRLGREAEATEALERFERTRPGAPR